MTSQSSKPQDVRAAAARNYGCQSMTGRIKRLLLKTPKDSFISQEDIDLHWQRLNFDSPPHLNEAVAEYEAFADLLNQMDIDISHLPPDDRTTLDSLYVHDPLIVTNKGAILCNMGKKARCGEPEAVGAFLERTGIPVLGRIAGQGRLEGGDVAWIDQRTLAVGEGYRTNAEGIRQLRQLLGDLVDEVVSVPLPHWNGPADILHLMSIVSPIDDDLYLVYSKLMPVPFRNWLLDRGIRLIEVPEEEYDSMGCNVLAVAPRSCIMMEGNPKTKELLEQVGVEVMTYRGTEISYKGQGGPTCLTRPLLRE